MLTPVRPAEFVPGEREGRQIPGVAVALVNNMLVIAVAPVKSHSDKFGTGQSRMRFRADTSSPAVQHLAQKSIREGRLVYVKALIKAGCEEADIRNRAAAGRAIVIPDRAAPPVQRYAPDPKAFERVLRAGVESGVLSDALLPALGLLTGRRIGLLAYLYRQDLHFEHGVWAFRIRSHAMRGGSWERVPVKTDASLGLIVLPRILESCGFVDWAKSGTGPVFPRLMACQDPADAAQKRANRLIKDQFDEADPQWVFHCLRHGRIDNDRDAEVSEYITRKAVGHADQSIHGLDGQLTPKQKRMIADAPLPEGIDWLLLNRIDWEKFANAVPRVRRRKSLLLCREPELRLRIGMDGHSS